MALKLKLLYANDITANSTATPVQLDNGATKGWLIKSLIVYNIGGSAGTTNVDVYVTQATSGTTSYLYKNHPLALNQWIDILKVITLNHTVSPPDKIFVRGYLASGTQTLNCVVSGIERDQ